MAKSEPREMLAHAALLLAREYEEAENEDQDDTLVLGEISAGLILSCMPAQRRVVLAVIEAFEMDDARMRAMRGVEHGTKH